MGYKSAFPTKLEMHTWEKHLKCIWQELTKEKGLKCSAPPEEQVHSHNP
jgi:hypothetical protein